MVSAFLKIMGPLKRRVQLMVGRCVLKLVDDALPIQKVQITILDGEVHDGVERLQNFGHTGVPLSGARGATLSVGGERAHQVIVAMDDGRHRPQGLAGGESALYNAYQMHFTLLKDGTARLVCTKLEVQGDIVATGNITAAGEVADAGGSKTMSGMRTTFNGHTQTVSGGVAQTPAGVM